MSREVITEIENRKDFHDLLCNDKVVIIKFGAEWCKPCKKIKSLFYNQISQLNPNILIGDIDVDESFDVYAFLKAKRMVNGIPSIIAYKKYNENYIPDLSVTGANETAIINMFNEIKYWDV